MANIAQTGVSIVTRASGFVSGLRSANHAFKGFNRQTAQGAKSWSNNVGQSFASTIAKITILSLALRRVMKTVLSEFNNLDEARKFAQSIGQAGEFATDRLLAFEFAAKRVGASSAVARTGLRTMSKAIGEAQLGMGEGTQALKILGLDAQKLGTMLPTEAFLKISKAMNKMENSSLRTAAAQKLFGRAGVRMLNLARLQRKSIEELIERHKRLAGVLSEGDIAGVEATNDALGDLITAYKGLQRTIMAEIAPSLFTWFSVGADLIAKMRPHVKILGSNINEFIFKSLDKIAILLPGVINYFSGIAQAIWNGVKAAMIFSEIISDSLGRKYENPFELLSMGLSIVGEMLKELPKLSEQAFNMIGSLGNLAMHQIGIGISKSIDGILKALRSVLQGVADLVGAMAIIPGFEHMEEEAKGIENVLAGWFDPLEKNQERIRNGINESMNQHAKSLLDAWDKFNAIIDKSTIKGANKVLQGKLDIEALIEKYKKMFEDIQKSASAKVDDRMFKPPEEGDKKVKQQFGAFAELGSQEASRILASRDTERTIQQEQLGALRTLVRLVQVGNQNGERQYEAFKNDSYYTGGVMTR